MTPSIYVRVWRFGLAVASVLLFDFFTMTPDAHAQVPSIINYQGRVVVNGTNYTGNGQFKFALVDGAGTATYWSNGASAVSLTVTKGLFSVLLGDTSVSGMTGVVPAPVFSNTDVRLRVWFSPTGTVFQQLSPDQRIASSGYAMMAGTVPDGTITGGKIAAGAVQSSHIAAGAVQPYHLAMGATNYYTALQAHLAFTVDEAIPFDALQVVTASGGPVAFSCRVGGAVLGTVEGFIGSEQISSNYCYRVSLLSENPDLNGDDYVGQDAMLIFQRHGLMTFFDGMVSRFGLVGYTGHVARYVLEIVPHLSVLRYTTDYGIYQELSTPDIVKQVIRDAGLPDPDTSSLLGAYDRREYVVQYGETSLDFISRLMENEGIFYYFQHNDGVETLRLADPNGALAAFAEYAYHGDNADPDTPAEEYVKTFGRQSAMFTGRATVRDHDFKKPDSEIMGTLSDASGTGERYEFGLPNATAAAASQIARIRLERLQLERRTLAGSGNGGAMKAGGVFRLADGSGAGLGGDYVVTGVRHGGLRVASGTNVTFYYGNQFTAIPSLLPFRPAVRTPKPRATGPSSAVVVGLSGEDPYVDKYGRVKVLFHWGRKSGDTSVWIRVAQPYAGKSYGMTFLPGVGHEVVVDFLDGDPDRPIIVGSVHNGDNMPPYPLPARNATSTIKTRSNEIRFDDTVGSEELYVKGGRDLNVEVANDTTFDGGNDVAAVISNDATFDIANDVVFNGGRDMIVRGLRRLTLSSTNEINLNVPKTTVSGDFVLSSIAPTSTSSRIDYQVGELTRKTAPIALMVAGVSGTNLTTLSAYNCTAHRLEQGIYEITFRDLPANAYYAAAITPTAGIGVPLFANIIEKVRGSFIFAIADPGGTPVDKPFSVVVFGGF